VEVQNYLPSKRLEVKISATKECEKKQMVTRGQWGWRWRAPMMAGKATTAQQGGVSGHAWVREAESLFWFLYVFVYKKATCYLRSHLPT